MDQPHGSWCRRLKQVMIHHRGPRDYVDTRRIRPRFRAQTEVFSTDWSFGGGEDKRCGDDGTDSSWAESDSVQGLPAGLEQGDAAFAWSA